MMVMIIINRDTGTSFVATEDGGTNMDGLEP
jgi:hypothetical protein